MNLRIISCLFIFLAGSAAFAAEAGGLFVSPGVSVGYNSVQGTNYHFGLDVGYRLDEYYYFGVGAFYGFGEHPDVDREIGGGPFVGAGYWVTSFFSLNAREDIDYVDQRNPVLNYGPPSYYTYTPRYGVEAVTYGGVHLQFTRNLGLSAGYRWLVSLTNSAIADGRSSFVFGITIGI